MTTEEYRQLCRDIDTDIDDLPTPRNPYERALFRKRVSVEYGLLDDCIFDCPTMNQYFLPTKEEKEIYYTLDEELRDNRNYSDLSIPFEDLAYPRTIEEYMEYYHRLIAAPDSEDKIIMLNDIEYFEDLYDDNCTYEDMYSECFDNQFGDYSEQRYVALRIAYLKKEGYIS